MEIVAIVFGMPVAIVGLIKYFNYRTRRLEVEAGKTDSADRARIAELEGERAQLEERVQNLETIVTSVDLELNGRLNRLAAQQSHLLTAHDSERRLLAAPASSAEGAASPANHPPTLNAAAMLAGGSSEETAATLVIDAPRGAIARGTVLMNRFEVHELIGAGGMGAVYRAHDRSLGEDVALKTIGANISEDPDAIARFRREVGAARKITHKNVIRIHDLGEDQGLLFLSMEYFPGSTLAKVLRQRKTLPVFEALRFMDTICDAVGAAHDAGVVHRDLKPLNILVNGESELRVIDFGLAKASYMRTMTVTGMIMGTPEYMAPEQIRGQTTDHRTDIYALAAMAFHLLCGRPPFQGENPIAVGFQQCNDAPENPTEVNGDIPEYVSRAILRGLAKEPNERFESAKELKVALSGRSKAPEGVFA